MVRECISDSDKNCLILLEIIDTMLARQSAK